MILSDAAQRCCGELQKAMYVRSTYAKAMSVAGGEGDRELLESVKKLIEQVLAVNDGLAEMDSHLDGALSRPSANALLPGSQT